MRLAGKVALITGAAAGVEGELMGFGGAAARLFAREGARVVLSDIKEAMGFKTAAQIREQGGEAVFLRHDVTSEADWQEVIQTTLVTFGALNVLVKLVPGHALRWKRPPPRSGMRRWPCMPRAHSWVPSTPSPLCVVLVVGRLLTSRPSMA